MNFTATFVVTAVVVLTYMACAFFVASAKEKNSIADVAWGVGFILAALVAFALNDSIVPRKIVASLLVCLWGVRLAAYMWTRIHGKPDDSRYNRFRSADGTYSPKRSFFWVFMVQGILTMIIVTPVLFINTYGGPALGWLDASGIAIWVVGFSIEALADYQLFRFKRKHEHGEHILMSGLWRYSRHPNYLGEILMWCGIFLIALSVPGGVATAIGPLLLIVLLVRVSGIPLVEARLKRYREYDRYVRHAPVLIPWPWRDQKHPHGSFDSAFAS